MPPEAEARKKIDRQLEQAGWVVQDYKERNITAALGVAIREFPTKNGPADYLLYVDCRAIGVIEAKPEGHTLTGVEIQSDKYTAGLPTDLPRWTHAAFKQFNRKPCLPFAYESTGVETQFTSHLDPEPRSREIFTFHRPEELQRLAELDTQLRTSLQDMPELNTERLWDIQIRAVSNLETSLSQNRPRALIQMATGSGKTFTAATFCYRLIKFANAKRILFLVDRDNLRKQTFNEFEQYISPYNGKKFTQEFNVQRLKSGGIASSSRVCISTVQRLYSMLQGEEEFDEENEQRSQYENDSPLVKEPLPVVYSPTIPIETFDFIVIDECHRSIYNLWRQVLEYFDAFLIGLSATPTNHTIGFFQGNLVEEYTHDDAVADGVNVGFDVFRITTKITEAGATLVANPDIYVPHRDRRTRRKRLALLTEDKTYTANDLDRDVVAEKQIRLVRIIDSDTLQTVTPDTKHKTRFVIVDAVGVCERDKTNTKPIDRKPSVSLEKILGMVASGVVHADLVSTLAARLARMELELSDEQEEQIKKVADGRALKQLTRDLLDSLDPDRNHQKAVDKFDVPDDQEPTDEQLDQVEQESMRESLKPFHNPKLRDTILGIKKVNEQVIDEQTPINCLVRATTRKPWRKLSHWSAASVSSSKTTKTKSKPCRCFTAVHTEPV